MKVKQFKPRANNVLLFITFETSKLVIPTASNTKVLDRKVIAKGLDVKEDIKVGSSVLLHQQPMMTVKMDFEDCPKDAMYVLVTDRDILGIIESESSVILN